MSSSSQADKYWESVSEPRFALLCVDPSGLPTQRGANLRSERAARRGVLEAEQQAIKRVSCKLNTSLNDLQPVNTLPSEVLTHIFLLVMESTLAMRGRRTFGFTFGSPSPRWPDLVRVCKRWRAEAFACPSIWRHLSTSMKPKMITEFIRLSQDASLDIVTDRYRHIGAEEHLAVVFNPIVLDRARELSMIYGGLGGNPHVYLDMLARPMPRLEKFVYRHERVAGTAAPSETFLPLNLFNGIAPRLREFTLERPVAIPQPSQMFDNLRLFCLHASKDENAVHPLSQRLFELLDAMPRLERLELSNTLPVDPSSSYRPAPLVRPHLRKLVLEGPILAVCHIVRWLRLSSDCNVDVHCNASTAPLTAFAELVNTLSDAGIHNIEPRALVAESQLKGHILFVAYQQKLALDLVRDNPVTSFPADLPSVLKLSVVKLHVTDNSVIPTLIDLACQQLLSLEYLEILSLYVPMDEDTITGGPTASNEFRDLWRTRLGPCPALCEVVCAGASLYVLLREMAASHDPSSFLPAMTTLVFDELRISRHLLYEGESLYDLLLHALQHRAVPRTQICGELPFIDAEDLVVLEQLTTLERFYRDYGPMNPYIHEPPTHFFEFEPGWPVVNPEDAEMVELGAEDPQEDFDEL